MVNKLNKYRSLKENINHIIVNWPQDKLSLNTKIFKLTSVKSINISSEKDNEIPVDAPDWLNSIIGELSLTFKNNNIKFKYDVPGWADWMTGDFETSHSFTKDIKKGIGAAMKTVGGIDLKNEFKGTGI